MNLYDLEYLCDSGNANRKAESPASWFSFCLPQVSVYIVAAHPSSSLSRFYRVDDGQYEPTTIRLGSRGDSFYEYLL